MIRLEGERIQKKQTVDPNYVQQNFQNFQNDIVNVQESTELGESLKHLNDDQKEPDTKMSGIDMRTRLHFSEISGILAIDTLVSFNFIPERCLVFTRQKKRLAVSLKGEGRKEIVDISAGKRENDMKKGLTFGERIFGKKQDGA